MKLRPVKRMKMMKKRQTMRIQNQKVNGILVMIRSQHRKIRQLHRTIRQLHRTIRQLHRTIRQLHRSLGT